MQAIQVSLDNVVKLGQTHNTPLITKPSGHTQVLEPPTLKGEIHWIHTFYAEHNWQLATLHKIHTLLYSIKPGEHWQAPPCSVSFWVQRHAVPLLLNV